MEAEIQPRDIEVPHEVLAPSSQTLPLVVASPHSGRHYPPAFVADSRLDPLSLRRSEDSFVDELLAAAPALGSPLLRAHFPRAYIDVNREPFELDPRMFADTLPGYANTTSPRVAAGLGTIARVVASGADIDVNREPFELDPRMFADTLPGYANTTSPRVAAGLGTIARVVASGADIYRDKLRFDEALWRLRRYYWPYHDALRALIADTQARFGGCILLDGHSMPSIGGPTDRDAGSPRVDFVLGDCHGTACAGAVTEAAACELARRGYHVRRNSPYAGGFVTRHYGRPAEGVHALQIEVNRALYMDEAQVRRGPGLPRVAEDLKAVVAALGRLEPRRL